MSVTIDLQNDATLEGIPDIEHFELWVVSTLQVHHDNLEQTIRIVGRDEIQALNAQFRGRDVPTNILSFPANIPHIEYQNLGDLVICAPVVVEEARLHGKSINAYWAHMVVHGMLHLQGYDHDDDSEAKKMEALEIKILSTLDYSNPYNSINLKSGRSGNG